MTRRNRSCSSSSGIRDLQRVRRMHEATKAACATRGSLSRRTPSSCDRLRVQHEHRESESRQIPVDASPPVLRAQPQARSGHLANRTQIADARHRRILKVRGRLVARVQGIGQTHDGCQGRRCLRQIARLQPHSQIVSRRAHRRESPHRSVHREASCVLRRGVQPRAL